MSLKKEKIAELFCIDVENISSYTEEKTCNFRYGMTSVDDGELQQEIVIRVNLKKPVKEVGGWSSKLEYHYFNPIDTVYLYVDAIQ